MKKLTFFISFITLCSFSSEPTLKGTWKFAGGIYNGKKDKAPTGYALQRKYTNSNYVAFSVEPGSKPEKYEAGKYVLNADTCIDTETFCSQPSKITNVPIHYIYSIMHDTLTFNGTLPDGMTVVEYWKRVR